MRTTFGVREILLVDKEGGDLKLEATLYSNLKSVAFF